MISSIQVSAHFKQVLVQTLQRKDWLPPSWKGGSFGRMILYPKQPWNNHFLNKDLESNSSNNHPNLLLQSSSWRKPYTKNNTQKEQFPDTANMIQHVWRRNDHGENGWKWNEIVVQPLPETNHGFVHLKIPSANWWDFFKPSEGSLKGA